MKRKKEYVDVENIGPSAPLTPEEIQAISEFIASEKQRLIQEGLLTENKVKKREQVQA
jgi:hypothetical protein